jgi:hypothetical protein
MSGCYSQACSAKDGHPRTSGQRQLSGTSTWSSYSTSASRSLRPASWIALQAGSLTLKKQSASRCQLGPHDHRPGHARIPRMPLTARIDPSLKITGVGSRTDDLE